MHIYVYPKFYPLIILIFPLSYIAFSIVLSLAKMYLKIINIFISVLTDII